MSERALIDLILLAVAEKHPHDVRLFRNSVGFFKYDGPGGRGVRYGLAKGSADIIGIGPGGRFISIEVKTGKLRPTKQQRAWQEMVARMGGVAGVVWSVEEALALVGEAVTTGAK